MCCKPVRQALPHLALLLILLISFAGLPVRVHAGSSSDLTVGSIRLEDASQVGQPVTQLSPGQSFNIVATIKNTGQETAYSFYLDVYYDNDYGRGGPDDITPGEVQTWYVGPLTSLDGTHTTRWVVDPDNQIQELDETNNQEEYVFTVGSQTVTTTVTSSSIPSTTQFTSTSTSPLAVNHALGWLPEDVPEDARVKPVVSAALPTHFDWRQKDGQNWVTSVKDQGGCGSCVAFAAVATTEAQFRIAASNPSWDLDLSEQHPFSCGGGQCGWGWHISNALDRLRDYGTPDEACSPYQSGDGNDRSCPTRCGDGSDWQSRAFKISSWNWIDTNPSSIQAALMNGPLVAGFDVYSDFFHYAGGIYHYSWGDLEGGHAITIVGYDSNERYWIVKNSWGASWEENGYFKIGFGEARIEQWVASIQVTNPVPEHPVEITVAQIQDVVRGADNSSWILFPKYGQASCFGTTPSKADVLSLGFLIGSLVNPQNVIHSMDSRYLSGCGNPSSIPAGAPIVSVAGLYPNMVTKYYELQTRESPLYYTESNGQGCIARRDTGEIVACTTPGGSVDAATDDIFAIQAFTDSTGHPVYLFWGIGWKGTLASTEYLVDFVLKNPSAYNASWYVYRWTDASSGSSMNTIPDAGDTFTPIASG